MKRTVKKINKFFLLLGLFVFKGYSYALADNVVSQKIETAASELKDTVKTITVSLVGVVLLIGLIIMIYKVATSDQRSREWVIGWVAAALLYGIAITIVSAIA